MQTKKHSLFESIANTTAGFIISFTSVVLLFPLFGIPIGIDTSLYITLYFTVISIMRGYIIRRVFNG